MAKYTHLFIYFIFTLFPLYFHCSMQSHWSQTKSFTSYSNCYTGMWQIKCTFELLDYRPPPPGKALGLWEQVCAHPDHPGLRSRPTVALLHPNPHSVCAGCQRPDPPIPAKPLQCQRVWEPRAWRARPHCDCLGWRLRYLMLPMLLYCVRVI